MTMADNLFRRTTFLVPDARAAAQFYIDVFGWKKWYDNELSVDWRFPPAAPDGARAHLVLLQVEDPKVGMLGLLQYLEPPFDTAVPTKRSKVRMGEAILVIETREIDAVHQRALKDGKGWIQLRSMSLFDPNGIYMEVNVLL
jgi:catechol 2,3-dioxygenase-like lactoylglutathione lyase family enzyme